MESTKLVSFPRRGEREHAGSVAWASPVSRAAWQRQPPKSISRIGHSLHGTGIQAVPRKRLNDSDWPQIQSSGRIRTFSKRRSLMAEAVGQGRTSPTGLTVKNRVAQPFMQGFGRSL